MGGSTAAPRAVERVEGVLPSTPGFSRLGSAGEIGDLFLTVIRTAVRRPFSWRGLFLTECDTVLRRCLLPAVISIGAFALGLAVVYVGGIVKALGTTDRIGGGVYLGFCREPSVWVTTMILAGVAGSAMTADLAARKIRDELDALTVLGTDTTRMLIIPRVFALAVMAPILGLLTLWTSTVVCYIGVSLTYKGYITPAGYIEATKAFVNVADLVNQAVKLFVAGMIVGVVSCHKGLTSSGGAEGVGRAVNQAVLISFFAVWTINVLGNTIFLSVFPNAQILRG
jgi:phospholipid/cholesterol/gamma-HCH transport system permease protein